MDISKALQLLAADDPSFFNTMREVSVAVRQVGAEDTYSLVLDKLLRMTLLAEERRALAADLLLVREHTLPAPNGDMYSHALRHVPDIILQNLCAIVGTPMRSAATPEWLVKMRAQVDDRPLPPGHFRVP